MHRLFKNNITYLIQNLFENTNTIYLGVHTMWGESECYNNNDATYNRHLDV